MGTHIHTVVYTQLYMHMHSYTGAHIHKVATYVYAQLHYIATATQLQIPSNN